MLNETVLSRLVAAGQTLDVSNPIYMQAEAVASMPRVLDSPPKPITLRKLDDSQAYGACNEFVSSFTGFKQSMNVETSRVQIGDMTRFCDPDIYYALHCLGVFCTHSNKERAVAAGDLFKLIMTTPGEVLTTALVYERLNSVKKPDYYKKEFLRALKACLFINNSTTLLWLTLASDHGYYANASEAGRSYIESHDLDEKGLKKFLNEQWALAKEDSEFMKKILKPVCNKWMVGMIYALHTTNPDVLRTVGQCDGFR